MPPKRRVDEPLLINEDAKQEFLDNEAQQFKKSNITPVELDFLLKLYFKTKEGFGLGRDRFFKYLQENYPDENISRRKVNRFLQALEITQLFNPIKSTKNVAVNIPSAPFKRMEMDLLDMATMESNGYKFILNVIDTFSKYAISVPLKSKDEKTVVNGMKKILQGLKKQYDFKSASILNDNGNEFKNSSFQKLMSDYNITQIFTNANNSSSHAKQVENFNGYLRRQIAKYQNQFDDNRWDKYLNILVRNYNRSPSRITKKTPESIIQGDIDEVKEKIRDNVLPKNEKSITDTYKVGDIVRLKQQMGSTFEKPTANIRWSKQLYTIDKVIYPRSKNNLQPRYRLKTYADPKKINEDFYHNDLQVVNPKTITNIQLPEKFIVQNIQEIKEVKENGIKRKKVLVKWQGYKEPTWEDYAVIQADVPKLLNKFMKQNSV